MFGRLQMPALDGGIEWLNSEPLGPAELRGHVVLVNFWTLTCINRLRTAPYVRAWAEAYRDDGLIVIGVHTPEFSFEHDVDRVRRAIADRTIDYPVVLDNDYEIWRPNGSVAGRGLRTTTRRAIESCRPGNGQGSSGWARYCYVRVGPIGCELPFEPVPVRLRQVFSRVSRRSRRVSSVGRALDL